MITDKNLRTVCAYDNYDRFIETTGKPVTMNDTVGILAQDVVESDNERADDFEMPLDAPNSTIGL